MEDREPVKDRTSVTCEERQRELEQKRQEIAQKASGQAS